MQKLALLSAVAMLALGCNQGGNAAYSPPPNTGGASEPAARAKPNASPDKATLPNPKITFRPETFKIEPQGAKGWKKDEAELPALGRKIDDALLNVREALVAVDTNYSVGGNELTGRGMVKIRDRRTFNIEFITPQTEAKINRAYGLNGTRKLLYNEKWEKLPEVSGNVSDTRFDEQGLRSFAGSFSAHVFDPILRDKNTYGPLFSSLDRGDAGFKATIESKKDVVQGRERSYYRILADSTKGDLQLEILVDANRFLPLTVRSVKKNGTSQDVYMWSGSWAFGGKHADRDFAIPAEG